MGEGLFQHPFNRQWCSIEHTRDKPRHIARRTCISCCCAELGDDVTASPISPARGFSSFFLIFFLFAAFLPAPLPRFLSRTRSLALSISDNKRPEQHAEAQSNLVKWQVYVVPNRGEAARRVVQMKLGRNLEAVWWLGNRAYL